MYKETIPELVYRYIDTDDSHSKSNDIALRAIYNNATKKEQSIVDAIFINLCGFSLNTILNGDSDEEE